MHHQKPTAIKAPENGKKSRRKSLGATALIVLTPSIAIGAVALGLYIAGKEVEAEWKSRTPMCEGPVVYHIQEGHESPQHGFGAEKLHSVKKGGTFKVDGITYSILGHVDGRKKGGLVVQETDTEVLSIIKTYREGVFSDRLRFYGWTCEKPESAKSE